MPRKCDTCKHFRILYGDRCSNREIARIANRTIDTRLDTARDICNRESNGIFVYFEPKTPTAGAAFAATAEGRNTTSSECVPEPAWPEDWLEDAINHFLTAVAGGAQ